MKTRYPIKIIDRLFPMDTPVRPATPDDMLKIWPAQFPDHDSENIAVWFPEIDMPIVIAKTQINMDEPAPPA